MAASSSLPSFGSTLYRPGLVLPIVKQLAPGQSCVCKPGQATPEPGLLHWSLPALLLRGLLGASVEHMGQVY